MKKLFAIFNKYKSGEMHISLYHKVSDLYKDLVESTKYPPCAIISEYVLSKKELKKSLKEYRECYFSDERDTKNDFIFVKEIDFVN